jgi:hypothetical protein
MIDIGKHKYKDYIDNPELSFNLYVENFDTDSPTNVNYDWVFHNTNVTVDYGNFKNRDRYDYLEQLIKQSMSIVKHGSVFMLLNDNVEYTDGLYISYSFTEVGNILYRLGYKFGFDNTDFSNVYKLIILNNKF